MVRPLEMGWLRPGFRTCAIIYQASKGITVEIKGIPAPSLRRQGFITSGVEMLKHQVHILVNQVFCSCDARAGSNWPITIDDFQPDNFCPLPSLPIRYNAKARLL